MRTDHSRLALRIAIFAMVLYTALRWAQGILVERSYAAATRTSFFVLLALALIIISARFAVSKHGSLDFRPFLIPTVMFLSLWVDTITTREVDSYIYFLLALGICAVCTVTQRFFHLLAYLVVSNGLTVLLIAVLPKTGTYSAEIIFVEWGILALAEASMALSTYIAYRQGGRSEAANLHFNSMLETTHDFVFMVDKLNRVTYISKSMADWVHADYTVVIGKPVLDLFKDMELKLMIGDVLEKDSYDEDELPLQVAGEEHYFKIRSARLLGKLNGYFVDFVDVTPLVTARKGAQAADQAKTAFLAKTSHEIRTPMNAITGLSELILRENPTPQIREYAREVQSASGILNSIISDVLDFSKMERGMVDFTVEPYDFDEMISAVCGIIKVRMSEKEARFVVDVDPALPKKLVGDGMRMRQILLNLLSNAAKFTDKGSVTLTVTGTKQAASNGTDVYLLEFVVQDTGKGIAAEDLPKLFGEFVQVDKGGFAKNVGGTGLGLAISRSLARGMGGDITVTSVYGEGSRFVAAIPQDAAFTKDEVFVPFARLENAANLKAFVLESKQVYSANLTRSLSALGVDTVCGDNVGAMCDILHSTNEKTFTHVFLPLTMLVKARQKITANNSDKTGIAENLQYIVVTDFGEDTGGAGGLPLLEMPAHVGTVAAALSGVTVSNTENTDNSESGQDNNTNTNTNPGGRVGTGTLYKPDFSAPSAEILIVDDVTANLMVAEGLLKLFGAKITCVNSGEKAIAITKERSFDLIFMDHMMPGIDGVEATRMIRRGGVLVPVIALTANAVVGAAEYFMENGFVDLVTKPVYVKRFAEMLEKWLPPEKIIRVGAKTKRLFEIEGLDDERGQNQAGGDTVFYKKVLAVYADESEASAAIIERAITDGDLPEMASQAHALKGASLNIGAIGLSQMAAELEHVTKANDREASVKLASIFAERIHVFAGRIRKTLAALPEDKTPDGNSGEKSAVGGELALASKLVPLQTELRRYAAAVEDMDVSAMETILQRLSDWQWGEDGKRVIADASKQLLFSEFETSQSTLARLTAILEENK